MDNKVFWIWIKLILIFKTIFGSSSVSHPTPIFFLYTQGSKTQSTVLSLLNWSQGPKHMWLKKKR